ncbi:MAG: hypothetical protein GF401_06165 [Chitinivibrionales bacterium]|nr:hypothetical protein [Chitinivibrionales bacterium]
MVFMKAHIVSGFWSIIFLLLIVSSSVSAAEEEGFSVGGAVRYNIFVKMFEDDEITSNDIQATWDTWRLNVSGQKGGMKLNFEYRFYPTFATHFIHHGWIGYDFNEQVGLQLGVTQVPFGDLTYASHSWWFSTAYYAGLEDDYDMGLKLSYNTEKLDLDFAYFYMPEPAGPAPEGPSYGVGGSGRYSYDIIPDAAKGASIRERNQANIRAAYTVGAGEPVNAEVGLSGQFGMLYNSVLDENGTHLAGALHIDANIHNLNLKAHAVYFNHMIDNDDSTETNVVQMGAYGSGTYPVAAQALMVTGGAGYTFNIEKGPFNSVTVYDDFTYTHKMEEGIYDTITNEKEPLEPTMQNTVGALVAAGPIYTYIDLASGVNHPWLTNSFGTGLGKGLKDASWNHRFNVNLGYYF